MIATVRSLPTWTRVLGVCLLVLFVAVQATVVRQSFQLSRARATFEAATYPVTDLANTQRQAERLRSSVLSQDEGLIATDLGLLERQVVVARTNARRLDIDTLSAVESTALAVENFRAFLDAHGVAALVADPVVHAEAVARVDQLSMQAKLSYDRQEQHYFELMLHGVDQSSALGTLLVVLGAMTLLLGVVFGQQLLRSARDRLARANAELVREMADRMEGERRLELAFNESQRAEARARSMADELDLLQKVVLAGVGGGAMDVCARVVNEMYEVHGLAAVGVVLEGDEGPGLAAWAGPAPREGLIQVDGPLAYVLSGAAALELSVGTGLTTLCADAMLVQVAPISSRGRLVGALVVESRSVHPQVALRSIERLGAQLGLLLEAARAFDDQLELTARFRELDELKTEFVATVSHELRTPLTAIVGMALTLDEYWDRVDEGDRRDMVTRMRRQARRQQRLVDDLLTISRLQHSGVIHRPERVDLAEAVAAVLDDLDGEFTSDVRPGIVAWADRDHVERILTNYVTNALKYAQGAEIVVTCEVVDGMVQTSVADAGPGVPPEFEPRLFDRFTQASGGSTRTSQGVGLGLSIVQTLAAANGGRAWHRVAPGGGAIFGVDLPLPVDRRRPESSPPGPSVAGGAEARR